MSASNDNNEADASSADVSTGNARQDSNEPVFAVPALPVRKATAMGPPPPPLFPKEQRETSNVKENAPGSSAERTEKAPPPSKEPGTSTLSAPPLKYQKPAWSGYPNQQFFFEVIKNGVIVEKITAPLKEFLTVGRLPMCDLEMAHPFKSSGECFIYDLNSSHGTKLNKNKIPPGMHVALKPGDQLRFGESTRIYLFQTEEEVDQEEEERKLVNAMIERQNRSKTQQQRQQHEDDEEEAEFNWGMAPDAVDEDEDEEEGDGSIMEGAVRRKVDPDASYRNDPKKALRNYLQNKGYSCDFEVEESGPGHAKEYTARIRLPIETSMGPVYGQATAGKKRDAEREAALDACIQLDSRGMLGSKSSGQKSGEDPSQGKSKYDRSDDDDDDDFYDRTVKKKSVAARKAEQKADTYESLLEKHKVLLTEMAALETKIQDHDTIAAERKRLEESGDLDGYMALLEKSGGDSKPKMQQNLSAMRKEEKRLLQLIELTKPVDILAKIGAGAPVKGHNNTEPSSNSTEKKRPIDNTPTTGETKKPRVLGPSLPPPAS
ncbi:Kanadaptin [Mortierella sp. NVP85]|nr:Kanadaptin [Mortierella sp. NVP85]